MIQSSSRPPPKAILIILILGNEILKEDPLGNLSKPNHNSLWYCPYIPFAPWVDVQQCSYLGTPVQYHTHGKEHSMRAMISRLPLQGTACPSAWSLSFQSYPICCLTSSQKSKNAGVTCPCSSKSSSYYLTESTQ